MNRLLVYIGIGTLILLSSCAQKTKKVAKAAEKGDIVLILDNIPENYKFYYDKKGDSYATIGGSHEIEYHVKDMIPSYFYPDYTRDKDTIVIKSVTGYIEIQHRYRGIETFSYLAQPKDTLFISYKDKMPIVRNSRKCKKYDYDYEVLLRKKVYGEEYSGYANFMMSFFISEDIGKYLSYKNEYRYEAMKSDSKLFHTVNYNKAMFQFDKEEKVLDSLIVNDYISKDVSDFYRQRIKYNKLNLEIQTNRPFTFKDFKQTDSLIKYSFYRNVINIVFEYTILKKLDFKKKRNYLGYNSEEVYDAIQKAPYLSHGTRKYLLHEWFKIIAENTWPDTVREYYKSFKTAYGKDTCLINNLVKEYKIIN